MKGKFLSYMISQIGIKSNLGKNQEMLKMEPSKNIKEIQRLNVKVEAFHKFISKVEINY